MVEFVVAVLWSAVEVLIVLTGMLVVRVISLGRWRAEDQGSNEARVWGAAGALWFRRDGQCVVTANGLLFVGLLFYALLALAVVGLVQAVPT